jgi:hypothetical protein
MKVETERTSERPRKYARGIVLYSVVFVLNISL